MDRIRTYHFEPCETHKEELNFLLELNRILSQDSGDVVVCPSCWLHARVTDLYASPERFTLYLGLVLGRYTEEDIPADLKLDLVEARNGELLWEAKRFSTSKNLEMEPVDAGMFYALQLLKGPEDHLAQVSFYSILFYGMSQLLRSKSSEELSDLYSSIDSGISRGLPEYVSTAVYIDRELG